MKTVPNDASVLDFINDLENTQRRSDSIVLLDLMERITGEKPIMWGSSIVGFGSYHYKYRSGREGDWFLTGFSPRKQSMTVYIMGGFEGLKNELEKLGRNTIGKSCIYIKRLKDIDQNVLEQMIRTSIEKIEK